MPTLPLHPAIVHVPLGLAFVLPVLTAALALAMLGGVASRRIWGIAVALQTTVVAAGGIALWAGERDEKQVERIVGEFAIEIHERAAEAFLWSASIVLVAAATVLILPSRAAARTAAAAALGTFVVAALAYQTGKAGGELVYSRGGAAAFATSAASSSAPDVAVHVREKHHD